MLTLPQVGLVTSSNSPICISARTIPTKFDRMVDVYTLAFICKCRRPPSSRENNLWLYLHF